MDTQSTHLLVEYYACNAEVLTDIDAIEIILRKAAKAAQTTVVGSAFHRYSPTGVSGILLVAESHISIHTWPEHLYAAVDIFTCGECESVLGHETLRSLLGAQKFELLALSRGQGQPKGITVQAPKFQLNRAQTPMV